MGQCSCVRLCITHDRMSTPTPAELRPQTAYGTALRWLSLLDEVQTWFKWKLYDVAFALLLLSLGRRFGPVGGLRRWLRELDAP